MALTPRLSGASPRVAVWTLVGLSLGLKAVFLVITDVPGPFTDAIGYLQRAHTIWTSGVFGMTPADRDVGNAPFYSIFLAPFVGLEGPAPRSALAAQAALTCLTVALAWWLGSRLGGRQGGWGAGLVCATYPPLTAYPFLFVTETLAVAQFVGAMALTDLLLVAAERPVVLPERRRSSAVRLAAWLGVLLAVASLTRAVMFPLILVPIALVVWRVRRDPKRLLPIVAGGLFAFMAAYGPWVLRNWHAEGRLIVLNERRDAERLTAHLTATFIRQGLDYDAARAALGRELARIDAGGAAGVTLPGPVSTVFWRDAGQRLAIMLGVHSAVGTPFPLTGSTTSGRTPVRGLTHAWHAVFSVMVLAALALAIRRRQLRLLATLALPGALIAVYALIHGIPRYQIVPFSGLTIPAGVALGEMWRGAHTSLRGRRV